VRLIAPEMERPAPNETSAEAYRRRRRNKMARQTWQREAARRCSVCGYANINVRHNIKPEDQLEGPAYYADMTDLHEFRS